jgi:hypothetical protein
LLHKYIKFFDLKKRKEARGEKKKKGKKKTRGGEEIHL